MRQIVKGCCYKFTVCGIINAQNSDVVCVFKRQALYVLCNSYFCLFRFKVQRRNFKMKRCCTWGKTLDSISYTWSISAVLSYVDVNINYRWVFYYYRNII